MDFDPGYVSPPSPGPSFADEEIPPTDSNRAESSVADVEDETGGRRNVRRTTESAELSGATLEFISEAPVKDRALPN